VGFFTCYGTVLIPSSLSWRLPLALQSGIAFGLALASFFYLPQSPRWLAYKGRKEEASIAWDKLGVSGAEREKNLLQDPAPMDVSERTTAAAAQPSEAKSLTMRDRLYENMKDVTAAFRGDARKPMLLGVFLMAVQQLSGIDGVIYVCTLQGPD
jgi:DNA-directed RNA polymerase III subunit RPC2